MRTYIYRTTRLIFGLFLFSLGSFLIIQANIGLAPWEAFTVGVSIPTGLSFGSIVILSGLIILVVDVLLKEKIGFGTILNTILIGVFMDLIKWTGLIPMLHNFWAGLIMLLMGHVVISIASFFYIGAGLGCGPRDALMVALAKRLPRVPVGAVRGAIEGTVLLIGWLLGAKIGFGTVISVFGIGLILQATFRILHFPVKEIEHESVIDTVKNIRRKKDCAKSQTAEALKPRNTTLKGD